MKKILYILLLLSSFLNASFLLQSTSPICIEDYYYKSSDFYFLSSETGNWNKVSDIGAIPQIISGYDFNSSTFICSPKKVVIDLGIDYYQYNFLNALIGLLFGFVFMVSTIYLFMTVGGKR